MKSELSVVSSEPKPRNKKPQKRVPFTIFEETANRLQISQKDLAQSIGVARATADTWAGVGTIPYYAQLACECLIRRNGMKGEQQLIIEGENVRLLKGDAEVKQIHHNIWVIE